MNKSERKLNPNDYQPKRFGLKYNPPQIVIEYLVPSTGKLYHHKIKLHKFKTDSNMQELIKEIYEKHYMYLDSKKINPSQVVKLVEKLNSGNLNMKKETRSESRTEVNQQNENKNKVEINELDDEENEDYYKFFDYDNEDLNKLEHDELQKRKDQMEKLYSKNAVAPGDENFVFDVRVR